MAENTELIECAICRESLMDPGALPCGNSYCGPPRTCLSSMETPERGIKCAVCRVDHNLIAADIKPLYGIREYIESGSKMKIDEKVILPCLAHGNRSCFFWCCYCNLMICEDFFDAHDGHLVRKLKKNIWSRRLSQNLESLGMKD